MPTVFNAANEWSVARFLKNEIGFLDIADNIAAAMQAHRVIRDPSLYDILETEAEVYRFLEERHQDQKI